MTNWKGASSVEPVSEDEAVEALSVVADVTAMEEPSQDDLAKAAAAQRVIDRFARHMVAENMARWQDEETP